GPVRRQRAVASGGGGQRPVGTRARAAGPGAAAGGGHPHARRPGRHGRGRVVPAAALTGAEEASGPGGRSRVSRMGPLPAVLGEPIRFTLNWGRRYSLWVFNFGLACCAVEFIASSVGRHDLTQLGVAPFAPGPQQADLMVVSGTVTDKLAPAIKRAYDQMPDPKYVISFG